MSGDPEPIVKVSLEDAVVRLKVRDDGGRKVVHTFRQTVVARSSFSALVGADWDIDQVVAAIRKYGIEEAGSGAAVMNHSLALRDEIGPVFFETLYGEDGP